MYILGNFWDKIGSAILESLRSLMMSLCEVIYKLIIFFFDIFIMLGNGSLLTDETLLEFYERIGLLIGLFMTFRVIFSLIQYVINPDMMIDKSKGLFNIIKRIIFVVVLLGTTPYIFKLAFNVQNMIIDSNIIPKVITGKNIDSSQSGETLAWYAFSAFFDYDEEAALLTGKNLETGCPYLNTGAMENNFKEDGNLLYAYNCVNVTENYLDVQGNESKVFIMRFDGHGIIPVIVGVVILWMILMYTIQVGIRVVQLAYLQLIAPAPIIMYLTPKGDETFNKWVKQCTTTYIDFFIRVAIMWFVIFIVDLLTGEDFQHFIDSIGAPSGLQLTWITIVMIIALLIFAQKIPKLFKELFPMSSGAAGFDFGLKAPKQLSSAATFATGTAVGALGGMATGIMYGKGWKGKLGGAFAGFGRGAIAGMKTKGNPFKNAGKGMANQRAASIRNYQRNHDGSTFFGRTALGAYGASLSKEALDRELKAYDDYKDKFDFVEKELEKNADVQFARYQLDQMLKTGTITSGVTVNGKPVIDKTTGKQVMKTRKITAADIKKANDRIKTAQNEALVSEIKGGNSKIINAMQEAEVIRSKGVNSGYKGFTNDTLIYDDPTVQVNAENMAKAFKENKDKSVRETGEIKRLDGSRHEEYKKVEANSKYNKTK